MSANIYRESAPPREMTESEYHMAGVIESLRERVADLEKTRRERIAIACLAGILANPELIGNFFEDYADEAVKCADALIARLDAEAKQ
jgi:hypothetical protein